MNDSTPQTTPTEIEEWRDIPGFEGRYQASAIGRIRSVPHEVYSARHSTGKRTINGKVLKQGFAGGPYLVVGIKQPHKKHTTKIEAHRLIALAFLGPHPGRGMHVHHIDHDKANNRADNLRYVTSIEHPKEHFSNRKGHWFRISPEQLEQIRALINEGLPGQHIADMFGISQPMVSLIKHGKLRKYG